jgi:hypothetical protein
MRKLRLAVVAISCTSLVGCASQSARSFASLDRSNPAYQSDMCQQAIRDAEIHDDIKLGRMVASPVAVILSGGLLLPAVLAANVGLNTVDHVDAAKLDWKCGGKGKTNEEILESVAKGAAFDIATGAVGTTR